MERGVRPSIFVKMEQASFFCLGDGSWMQGCGWDENSFIFISLDLINTN